MPTLPSSTLAAPNLSADDPSPRDRAGRLAELRARIRRIEGAGGEGGRTLPFGVEAVDGHLPDGGLPLGCLHAVTAEDAGAGTAFAAALLARLATPRAPVLWILRGRDLHAPGLAAYGLTPDRLVAVRAVRPVDALWAMEEALRCAALSAVLGELGAVDLTASRRLQLAAESSGVTGLLLDLGPARRQEGRARAETISAAVTRWRLEAAPSRDEAEDAAARPAGGLPGLGPGLGLGLGSPRWRVALERCRAGRPGHWVLGWERGVWREVGDEPVSGRIPETGLPERWPAAWPTQQGTQRTALSEPRHHRLSGSGQ